MELFDAILPAHQIMMNLPRLGLRRVQTVFEHPILFGVVCSCAFALTHLVLGWGKSLVKRWSMSGAVALSVLVSLSSGPISALAAQVLLLAWGWSLKAIKLRWKILIGLVALAWLLVELFAKRSVPQILFASFALDVESAYFRLLIWDYGTQSAMNHPWFGVGFGEWDRPYWLGSSIDMFWLYNAVVFGLPAGVLMGLTFFAAILPISLKPGFEGKLYAYRQAYLISMIGMLLVGWTVHFWNAPYVLFLFLLGSGMWMLDYAPDGETAPLRTGVQRRTDGIADRADRGPGHGLGSAAASRRAARSDQVPDEAGH
jgi:O-antigen ligase